MQAADIYAQLAAELAAGRGAHALLGRMLEPIVRLTGARAGAVSVKSGEDGRMLQIDTLEHGPPGPGMERNLVLPLRHRGRELGEYTLRVAADAVLGAETAAVHRTVGALLALALHEALLESESRQAVVADVHDGIAQTLAFARMRLPLLEQAITAHDDAGALRYCGDVRRAVSDAHTNLRAILSQCGAPMDPRGLKHALGASIRAFREQTGIELVLDDRAPGLCLGAGQEAQVYLIVQEALANIAKHAGARQAWLHIVRHGDEVEIVVEDDGAGLPPNAGTRSPQHLGIDIMRQRAARLGGGVAIRAREGGGTCLRLHFPCAGSEGATR